MDTDAGMGGGETVHMTKEVDTLNESFTESPSTQNLSHIMCLKFR